MALTVNCSRGGAHRSIHARTAAEAAQVSVCMLTVLHGAHGVVVLAHNHEGVQPLVGHWLVAVLLLRSSGRHSKQPELVA